MTFLKAKKPPRTTPTQPNYGIGKTFVPAVAGSFYLQGQTITKVRVERSKLLGPFKYISLTQGSIWANDGVCIGWENNDNRWIIDTNPTGYFELIIFNGNEEVPDGL